MLPYKHHIFLSIRSGSYRYSQVRGLAHVRERLHILDHLQLRTHIRPPMARNPFKYNSHFSLIQLQQRVLINC